MLTMQRDEAISKMRENVDAVRALGATSLFVFGSTARDEASADSDLDVFVEYDPAKKFSLFDLAGIKVLLEEKLGVEVDVTTRDSLHPLMRKRIEQSAIRIF
jgi:predicted nucleotidyltransferase